MLFNIYDVDQSGALDYKEFSAAVFGGAPATPSQGGGKASQMSQGGNQGGNSGASDAETLAEQLKAKLATRGARGIIGLQR